MSMTLPPKSPNASLVETTHLVLTHHINAQGTIFGGVIMSWIDIAAACAAYRHARQHTVTASMDHLDFYHPVHLGDMVILKAQVNYAGTTSMEVEVSVISEKPLTGECHQTSRAYLTFVAVDPAGKPLPVPPLLLATLEEKQRFEAAKRRRADRLAQRQSSPSTVS